MAPSRGPLQDRRHDRRRHRCLVFEALTKACSPRSSATCSIQWAIHGSSCRAAIAPLSASSVSPGGRCRSWRRTLADDGSLRRRARISTAKRFGLMLEALDDLRPGEIYLATGASLAYALWGGLMSTRALHLKAPPAPFSTAMCATRARSRRSAFRCSRAGSMRRTRAPRGKVVDFRVRSRSAACASRPATSSSATARACW